jgi:hypothetical protein
MKACQVKVEPRSWFTYTPEETLYPGCDVLYAFSVLHQGALEFALTSDDIKQAPTTNPLRAAKGCVAVTTEDSAAPIALKWYNPSYFQPQTVQFTVKIVHPLGGRDFRASEKQIALVVDDDDLAVEIGAKYGISLLTPDLDLQAVKSSGKRFFLAKSTEQAKGLFTRALLVKSEAHLLQHFSNNLHAFLTCQAANQDLQVVLGTMNFYHSNKATAFAILDAFRLAAGSTACELDSARVYGTRVGETESVLGAWLAASPQQGVIITLASKASPLPPLSFRPTSLRAQFQATCKALKVQRLDVYYLHAPDPNIPITQVLATVDEIHKAGGFAELGLVRFSCFVPTTH